MIKIKKSQIKSIKKGIKKTLNKQLNCSITIRCNDKIKKDAKRIFDDVGIDLSTAINIFLKKSIQFGGIPFIVNNEKSSNAELKNRMETAANKISKMVSKIDSDINEEKLIKDIIDYRRKKYEK